jgi:hypothetical protein
MLKESKQAGKDGGDQSEGNYLKRSVTIAYGQVSLLGNGAPKLRLGNAKPLVPSVVESRHEQPEQCGLAGEFEPNQMAASRKR